MNASIQALAVLAVALSAGPVAAQQQLSAAPTVYVDPSPYQNGSSHPNQHTAAYVSPYQFAAQAEEGPPTPPPALYEKSPCCEQTGCGSSCGSSCGCSCGPICDRCCRTHGLVVGAEIGFLKPHHSNGAGLS